MFRLQIRALLLISLLLFVVACKDKKVPPDDDKDSKVLGIQRAARWGELCGVLIETACIETILQTHNPFHCTGTQETLDAVIDLCD